MEKHKRLYQTDQEIHQQYVKMTIGGGDDPDDHGGDEVGPDLGGSTVSKNKTFSSLPWDFDLAEMESIVMMKTRTRLTKLAKDLVALPCFGNSDSIRGPALDLCHQRESEQHASVAMWLYLSQILENMWS